MKEFQLDSLKGKNGGSKKEMEQNKGLELHKKVRVVLLQKLNFNFIQETENNEKKLECPERELFVYSILFNRPEASLCFWENLQCKTSAALFAVWILDCTLQTLESRMDLNLHSRIEEMRQGYEERAIGILNHCYEFDKKKCRKMMQAKHEYWGNRSCIDLALLARTKSFIAQSACQSISKKDWRGDISYWNSRFQIALAILLPPLIIVPLWIHFKPKGDRKSEDDKKSKGESTSESDEKLITKQLDKFKSFYTAPIVVFSLNAVSYFAFLCIFSWIVLNGETI